MNNQELKHLTQEALARRWNISPRTLERWRWLRKGPPYLRIGGRIVYRLVDIEAFEAARLQSAVGSEESHGSGAGHG
jgi:hypothetical protein